MHEDILKGDWNQLKGEVQQQWGKLTGNEVDQIRGETNKLVGFLQERYGMTVDKARSEVGSFIDRYDTMVAEGEWDQFKGKVQQKWGQLTGSDLHQIKGRRSQLAGVLQQRYGRSQSQALRDVDDFMKKL